MTLPRILHRIYARVRGYRWKPCPICKRAFGAHEGVTCLLVISTGNAESVCGECAHEAVERNKRFAWMMNHASIRQGVVEFPEAS